MKKGILAVFISLVIFSFISASDITTNIQIRTVPFSDVHLAILNPDSEKYNAYFVFTNTTNAEGFVNFTYTSSYTNFDLNVIIKRLGKTIYSHRFNSTYVAGSPIYLEIVPEGYSLPRLENSSSNNISDSSNQTNASLNSSFNNTDNNSSEQLSITGNVSKQGSGSSKTIYYIIGAVILLGVLFFLWDNYRKRKQKPVKIKIRKLGEATSSPATTEVYISGEKDEKNINALIKEAEQKIEKAKQELNELKKAQRIKEIKEKIAKEQKELQDLLKKQ